MAQKLKQLDFPGIILNVGAFVSLIMALTFGGTEYKWSDGREIALWVVGGVLMLSFVLQQAFSIGTTPETRLFPVDFLQKRIMWILFALMSAASTCVFVCRSFRRDADHIDRDYQVPTYYIPLYFQFVRGDGPLAAAVRLLPFICIMIFFGLLNGALMTKFGYYMPWYFFGGAFALTGASLMCKPTTLGF